MRVFLSGLRGVVSVLQVRVQVPGLRERGSQLCHSVGYHLEGGGGREEGEGEGEGERKERGRGGEVGTDTYKCWTFVVGGVPLREIGLQMSFG